MSEGDLSVTHIYTYISPVKQNDENSIHVIYTQFIAMSSSLIELLFKEAEKLPFVFGEEKNKYYDDQ